VNASTYNGNTNSDSYAPAFALATGGYTSTIVPATQVGAPAYVFPTVPTTGVLPLQGPNGQVSPRVRPLSQVVPYIYAYNLTVQQQLGKTTNLSIAYVGNEGRH